MTKQKKIEFLKELLKVFEKFDGVDISNDSHHDMYIGNINPPYDIEIEFDAYEINAKLLKQKIKELEGED